MTAELPSEVDVVVIGGGVVGASVAYHLAEFDAGDVLLLERKKLTSGTTWHSAGQVRQLRSSQNLTNLIRYSTELYSRLGEETGQDTGWIQSGSIVLAATPERLTYIRRQAGIAWVHGVEMHEIGPDEISKHWPLLNVSDVLAGIHCPGDGRVNPSDVTAALVKGGRAKGLRIAENCPVTGFELRDGAVTAVDTAQGRIGCRAVALCAGLWSREVAALAGLHVPVFPCEHFYLLTKPIEGVTTGLPTLGNHDSYLYVRDEGSGLLVGCFEPGAKPVDPRDLPKDFEFDLLDEDWDHFEPMMHNALHRVPILETAEVRMLLNGPESFTPDGQPIVGESAEVRGFYMACGMNSAGVASAGGVGKALAEWIIAGQPNGDFLEVEPDRFHPVQCRLPELADRAAESLTHHYEISFPGQQLETARDLRKTPLYDSLAAAGAVFGQRYGAERALYFDPKGEADGPLTFGRPPWHDVVARECAAARSGVGLVDDSLFGKIRVEGRDAEAFLDSLMIGDMRRAPGRVTYTAMLNARGGIESDLTVLRESETIFLLYTNASSVRRDLAYLKRHLTTDKDVALTDVTEDFAVIGVMGPAAPALLQALSNDDFAPDSFPYFSCRPARIADHTVKAARLSYAGELGWELTIAADHASALYDTLAEAGVAHGAEAVGAFAMNALRLEKGYLSFGHDMGPDDTPLEAGLGAFVKGDPSRDFIGREALERQKAEGLGRRLVTLIFEDGDVFPYADEPIIWRDEIVGQVTSAAFGHSIGRSVGLGYVQLAQGETESALDGRDVLVDLGGRQTKARLQLQAAFDPKGRRVLGDYSDTADAA